MMFSQLHFLIFQRKGGKVVHKKEVQNAYHFSIRWGLTVRVKLHLLPRP